MNSESLDNERRTSTPDVSNAPDPHSKNGSVADEYRLRTQEMNLPLVPLGKCQEV
jgi:hypothetical protein